MTFFTIQEFKTKYNKDVADYQIEMACEMIYSQVGLRYRDPSWDKDTCPTAIKNASMEQLRFVLEYDIPVIAVVLENRTLGMVYQWQSLLYNERHSQTLLGNSPDFVKLAESFGVNGVRITKPGETKEALSKAIKDNEAILIDIIVDSEEALPMLPPGAGINEMIGEYKLEKDVI